MRGFFFFLFASVYRPVWPQSEIFHDIEWNYWMRTFVRTRYTETMPSLACHGVKAHGHPFTWAWIHRDITFFSSGTSPFLASNLPCRHGKIFVEFPGRNMEYWSENAVIRGNDNCRCPVTGPMISCRFLRVWRMCLYPQVPYYLGHAFKSWVALGDLATRRFSPRLISKAN